MRFLSLALIGFWLGIAPAWADDDGERSIWPRIAAGMQLDATQRPEVQRWIASYSSRPTAFRGMLERASPFLWFIVESAEVRELPMELVLLPAVESSFDAHARSVSAATGLWQFVPVTGNFYGLRENLSYDARRDPVASTRAALQHLQSLHREFGDWLLALAAYNAGAGRLKLAIRQRRSRDFWQLPLSQQTIDYVPKLLAVAALIRDPQRYGITLPEIHDRRVADLIDMDQRLSLGHALRAAQVDQTLLRRFNPGLKQVNHRAAAPTVLLPPVDALVVRAELAQAALSLDSPTGLSVEPPAVVVAAELRLDPLGLHRVPTPIAPVAEPVTSPSVTETRPPGGASRRHIVQRGETLFAISRRYQVSVESLRGINRIGSKDALSAGRELQIPTVAEQ